MRKIENIKKKPVLASVCLSVVLATVLTTLGANPVTHNTYRMLSGGTALCISNSTTASPALSNEWFYSYATGTNVLIGTTNNNGQLITGGLVPVQVFPDLNGDVNPNIALQLIGGFTNIIVPSKGNTQTPTLINTVWTNPIAFFTNSLSTLEQTDSVVVTLYAIGSGDMPFPDAGASIPAVRSFSFTCVQSNAVGIVVLTNLPANFLQGIWGVWPTVAPSQTGGVGQGFVLDALNLVGWGPQ